jgi:Lon protease-like protein
MEKFRILDEQNEQQYRLASVEPVPDPGIDAASRNEMRGERKRLEMLLVPQPDGTTDPKVPSSMPDEDLVNALAQYLEFEPVEKQALLERTGVLDRCRSLIELLEMKVLVARHKWHGDGLH